MRLPLFILLCLTILLSSCSEYQQVLRKDDMGKKYALAEFSLPKRQIQKSFKVDGANCTIISWKATG